MAIRNSSAMLRRQKDLKRGIRFTMMVVGASGTGKTTFINSILDQNLIPSKYTYNNLQPGHTIPKTITFASLNGAVVDAFEFEKRFDPQVANKEPGIAITETSVEIVDEDDSKLLLTIIDTPGFGDNINNEICVKEICNFLEQQFDLVLAEETRVRRNPRFEDTRVHICLYFIEPTGHGLRELDVDTMKKLSKYVNVLPVIARADSFTKSELANFKRMIMDDLEHYKVPTFQFTYDDDEEDDEAIEECHYLTKLQPFAIITSNEEAEINGSRTRIRRYPWGSIDINDTSVSDFAVLKSVMLGSHLQDLKDLTHDFLYEAYRTEKLSSVTDLQEEFSEVGSSNAAPSMSNLADIANSKSMDINGVTDQTRNMSLSGRPSDPSLQQPRKQRSMLLDKDASSPELIKPRSDFANGNGDDSIMSHEELKPITESGVPASPSTSYASPTIPNSPSLGSNRSSPVVNARQIRKISETVPYVLRHESLLTKQHKLERLEQKSAMELAKRAADLEKKAMELKLREKKLREQLLKKQELEQKISMMNAQAVANAAPQSPSEDSSVVPSLNSVPQSHSNISGIPAGSTAGLAPSPNLSVQNKNIKRVSQESYDDASFVAGDDQ